MNRIRSIVLLLGIIILSRCQQSSPPKDLFNGKDLAGWDTYLRPIHGDSTRTTDSIPGGLNNDPLHIFSVVKEDGLPALRISGAQHGGISTVDEYQNFHLTLEFKWGVAKTIAFANRKRDSGLLYFAVGPHGADYGSWMRSQEFQIQEGDCGDYWGVAGGVFDVPSVRDSADHYVYNQTGAMTTFSATSKAGRWCIKNGDSEKPSGEWNSVELYCLGDTAVHMVNGLANMVLYHSRQQDESKETPLKKGKIQLQSEGSEVFYRNIRITPITELPSGLAATK